MNEVQLFNNGTMKMVDNVILVKGLQNEIQLPDQAVIFPATCTATSKLYSQPFETEDTYFDEQSFIETATDDQIAELLGSDPSIRDTIGESVDMFVDDHPPQNQDLGSQHPSKQMSRFAQPVQIENYIYENKATWRKTLSFQKTV